MAANSRIRCIVWLAAMAAMLGTCPSCKHSSERSPGASNRPTSGAVIPASVPTPAANTSTTASVVSSQSTAKDQRRIHVFISGKVQGVGFRAFTLEHAQRLKLTGFVRNLVDGRVELVAEGSAGDVEKLIEQVRHGPPSAHVDGFDCKNEAPSGEFKTFEVR